MKVKAVVKLPDGRQVVSTLHEILAKGSHTSLSVRLSARVSTLLEILG